jgi:hypothetical protein
MNRIAPCCALAVLLMLGAGCADHSQDIQQLETQVAAQRRQLDTAEERWDSERQELRRQIHALRAMLGDSNADDAGPLAERLARLEAEAASMPDGEDADDVFARIRGLEDRLAEIRDEAVTAAREEAREEARKQAREATDERFEERVANTQPTKDLAAALERLNISEAERDLIRNEVIDAKRAMLELLDTPTPDGRNLAHEILDSIILASMGQGEPPNFAKLLGDLSRHNVPGDAEGRSYLEVMEAIKQRNREAIGRILTPEDQKKLDQAHNDWTEFEVGDDDPWGPLYLERFEKLFRE